MILCDSLRVATCASDVQRMSLSEFIETKSNEFIRLTLAIGEIKLLLHSYLCLQQSSLFKCLVEVIIFDK